VRLLEINALASLPEKGPVEAVDFMPDIEGLLLGVRYAAPRPLSELPAPAWRSRG